MVSRLYNPFIIESNSLLYFSWLQRTQWLSRSKLEEIQRKRLRLLVEHAFRNAPFHHKMFKAKGLKPSDVKSAEDLLKLPIMTKDDIRNNFHEFLSRDFQRYGPVPNSTSGSTGEPFRYCLDRKSVGIARAALWRGWGYAGHRLGDKVAVVAGLSLGSRLQQSVGRATKRVFDRVMYFPAINLRRETLKAHAERMLKFNPKFIRGYPSSLYFFASFLEKEKISDIHPKAVITTAEVLFPYQRNLLEKVFQCDVFDGYGAYDGGTGAFECKKHSGYHMAVEKTVMEFCDDDGNQVSEGEKGRIIATDLFNYAMPFIRYDTGDVGIYSSEECSCGRKLPLMKQVLGRTTDMLRFSNGAVLSGPSLTVIFKDFDFKQFQLVQDRGDLLLVRVIKGETFVDNDVRRLRKILEGIIGEGVEIRFEFVDFISPMKSGKWKFIISHV
jgi:phenylacetate-CoA ligase